MSKGNIFEVNVIPFEIQGISELSKGIAWISKGITLIPISKLAVQNRMATGIWNGDSVIQ